MSKRVEKKTAKRTRRSFTDEFKREAVALLLDGHSASSVADRLGLANTNLLYRWKHAPETPDLAVMLMKHARKRFEILRLIGSLHRRAEPVVPQLVDLFLEDWKVAEKRQHGQGDVDEPEGNFQFNVEHNKQRRIQIIDTLGEIGAGKTGYTLLKELVLVSNSKTGLHGRTADGMFKPAERAIRKFTPDDQPESSRTLLDDVSLINGIWELRTLAPGSTPSNASAQFMYEFIFLVDDHGDTIRIHNIHRENSPYRYQLDETSSPKQISISQDEETPGPDPKRTLCRGIYELTATTLRIQVAPPGAEPPTELVTDKEQLPGGHRLLEFDRSLEKALAKVTNAK